jgi:hypothetical protein
VVGTAVHGGRSRIPPLTLPGERQQQGVSSAAMALSLPSWTGAPPVLHRKGNRSKPTKFAQNQQPACPANHRDAPVERPPSHHTAKFYLRPARPLTPGFRHST